MDQDKISKIISDINQLLIKEETSLDEMESLIYSMIRFFLDNLSELEEVDNFQERLNEMIDNYVEEFFEGPYEENLN
jgi:hypothetical protein